MNTKSGIPLKAAILTVSLVQLGTNGIGPILARISAAFPDASDTTIQFLMTFPILFTMVFEIVSALIAQKLPKKTLSIIGLAIIAAGGVLAVLQHSSLAILFVWAGVIGVGLGMVAPIAPALINENYEGREKQMMLGWQNSASTIGSMIMTFACGFLAAGGWHFGYFVYLLAIPGIICALIGIPSHKKESSAGSPAVDGERGPFRLVVWREMIIACFFLMLYSAVPANLAMLLTERGIADPSVSGVVTTLFSLSGMLVGLVFGFVVRVFRKFTNTVGVIMLTVGLFIMGTASALSLMIVGCIVAGTSMSMVMPVLMGAASRLRGYEIMNSALIMASTSVGIFITPLLTSLTAAVTGSNAVSYRFIGFGLIGILLAVATLVLKIERKKA